MWNKQNMTDLVMILSLVDDDDDDDDDVTRHISGT